MYWIHPLWQSATLLLALYVLYLGWIRFAFVYLGRKGQFAWKRHVGLGKAALFMWLYGTAVGLGAAWVKWRAFGVTGSHFKLGLLVVGLALFGYLSGWRMDAVKAKRRLLPLLHGGANLLALLLSLAAGRTGLAIFYKHFLP